MKNFRSFSSFIYLFCTSFLRAHIHWMVAEEKETRIYRFCQSEGWWRRIELVTSTPHIDRSFSQISSHAMHKIRTAAAAASHIYVQINSFEIDIFTRGLDLTWFEPYNSSHVCTQVYRYLSFSHSLSPHALLFLSISVCAIFRTVSGFSLLVSKWMKTRGEKTAASI